MTETPAPVRLDRHTVSLLLATVLALTVVDVVLGRTLFETTLPALAADVGVAVAVIVARRHLLAAVLLAASASAAVSSSLSYYSFHRLAERLEIIDHSPLVGSGAWPGLAELTGMAVLCAMAIRHVSHTEAAIAAAAYGGALLAIFGWRQHGDYAGLFLLVSSVIFAATVATGLYSRSIEQRRVDEARATRQSERDAIARELHDLVAHHVTGIVVQAQAARLVAAGRPDVTEHALASIERAGADALSSMRAMVGALRADDGDAPIAPTATLDDIRRLSTPGSGGLRVIMSIDPAAESLASSVTASLHRIAIEAITNARRHGVGATKVDVSIACAADVVTLAVVNDGAVVTERQQGFGLVGIAERVDALGGRFEAGPRPNGGWALTATLPIDRSEPRPR